MADPLEEAFDQTFQVENTLLSRSQAQAPEPSEPEPPADTEPEVADTAPQAGAPDEEVPPDEPEPALLAGKYQSVEELEAGYKAIESKLGDGDYRALKDSHDQLAAQLQELREAQERQPGPPPTSQPEWLDEEAFTDPGAARDLVVWAAQTQHPSAYERAMGVWYEVDPRAATQFQLEVERHQMTQELEERLAPLKDLPEQQAAERARAEMQQAQINVVAEVAAANPDWHEYQDRIMDEARRVPELITVFQSGDTDAMARTLNLLLDSARQRRQQAATVAAAQQAEETNKAKAQANLTKATNTSQATPAPPDDPLLEIFDRAIEGLSPWAAAQNKR